MKGVKLTLMRMECDRELARQEAQCLIASEMMSEELGGMGAVKTMDARKLTSD